jgi:hypothetical protein
MRFRGEHSQTAAAAAAPGHEHNARDDINLKITVWLPWPRAGEQEVHVAFPAVAPPRQEEPGRPQSHERVIGDSPPPHAFDQALLRPMDAPIEADTVSFLPFLLLCAVSRRDKDADRYAESREVYCIIVGITHAPRAYRGGSHCPDQ